MKNRKNKKIRLAILFGGKSAEHEVSIQSARNITEAIDNEKYEVSFIGITKTGKWQLLDLPKLKKGKTSVIVEKKKNAVALIPQGNGELTNQANIPKIQFDVVFPILHGPFGEDGTVQGLLKLANVPFVGASVLGSAIGMDKDVMKRLLKEANIPVAKFISYHSYQKTQIRFEKIISELGLPFFVKPANLGSSVGISKIHDPKEFHSAVNKAFKYDRKILFEENIIGREIECSVIGNENPVASVPGEVIPQHEFYSYEAKYTDENGAVLKIPAELSLSTQKSIQEMAVKVFKVLECEGMARVDFFLKDNGHIVVNEINTIPGFTSISMYPKLWEQSGIPYAKLIDILIKLAIDRFKQEQKLKTSFVI